MSEWAGPLLFGLLAGFLGGLYAGFSWAWKDHDNIQRAVDKWNAHKRKEESHEG